MDGSDVKKIKTDLDKFLTAIALEEAKQCFVPKRYILTQFDISSEIELWLLLNSDHFEKRQLDMKVSFLREIRTKCTSCVVKESYSLLQKKMAGVSWIGLLALYYICMRENGLMRGRGVRFHPLEFKPKMFKGMIPYLLPTSGFLCSKKNSVWTRGLAVPLVLF